MTKNRRRIAVALAFVLILVAAPAPAIADEALPEEPLEAQIEEKQAEPAEAVEDEALPEEAPLGAAADEADPLDANSGGTVNVYRLFNRKTSEHLYTTSYGEYGSLPRKSNGDWVWEGVAWVAPKKSSTPVYRLYNKGLGDHHYTTSKGERDALTRKGWKYEGVAFYSDDSKRVPLYRVYNRRLKAGQHHYTTSKSERNNLVNSSGWRSEGVGWYAVKKGHSESLSKYRIGFVYDDGSFSATSWESAFPNMSAADKNFIAYMLYRLQLVGEFDPSTDVIDLRTDGNMISGGVSPESRGKWVMLTFARRSGGSYRQRYLTYTMSRQDLRIHYGGITGSVVDG